MVHICKIKFLYLLQVLTNLIKYSRATVTETVWVIDGEQAVQEIPVLRNKIQKEVEVGTFVRRRCVNAEQEQSFIN